MSANTSWSMLNFRKNLLLATADAGYSIVLLVPADAYSEELRAMGVETVPIEVNSRAVSPIDDFKLFVRYWQSLRSLRPVAFVTYTVKPNIYGSLAARVAGIPVFNNVTGLGTAFRSRGALQFIVSTLYRIALRWSRRVFFLNRHDIDLFIDRSLVSSKQAKLIPGEGVDLDWFRPVARKRGGHFAFLLASRLIWEKGIGEFAAAARLLRERGYTFRFQLLGFISNSDPSAITAADIAKWEREGIIDYLGGAADVRQYIGNADCVILPSWYPEGIPRVLMEAAAMAKPIITTDTPGCREVVTDGETGYLCTARSAPSLADAILRFVEMSEEKRVEMGNRGRIKAERDFDERLIIRQYLAELDAVVDGESH